MKKITPILFISIFLFFQCDKMEGPFITIDEGIETEVEFPELDISTVKRKILFEEYTGHRCSNCPSGHQKTEELIGLYGDRLVPVVIHAGSLAGTNASFTYDFRTEAGTELYNDFELYVTPSAVVNRTQYNGNWRVFLESWEAAIADINTEEIYAAIQIINEHNSSENMLKINTKVTMLQDYDHPLQLSFFLIEDGIISPQLNGSETDTNYRHQHVLRSGINGTYGTRLTEDGILLKDSAYLKSYAVDFSDKDWKIENCSAVVILLDPQTREVLQVEVKNNRE